MLELSEELTKTKNQGRPLQSGRLVATRRDSVAQGAALAVPHFFGLPLVTWESWGMIGDKGIDAGGRNESRMTADACSMGN
jgi:hypothetical protein